MPTLEVMVDTDEKTWSVKVNGEEVPSVQSVDVMNWGASGDVDPHFEIDTCDNVDGLVRRVCLRAGKKNDPNETLRASRYKGVTEVIKNSDVAEGLAELLTAYRRR